MSKYDKESKFYWLQLKEDFFEDDAIEWLEEQKPNGRDYAYFYLKLCLKSLKNNGILIRNVGNILIPYDNKKLAELTKIDFDTVTVAMELLKQIGLIQILENGEIYMTKLENLIGSVSKGALKKQQQRLIQKSDKKLLEQTSGGQVSTKVKDKVKDKDKNINKKENIKEKKLYGELGNVKLTDDEFNKLKDKFQENYLEKIDTLSLYIASKGDKYKNHYATILNWSRKENATIKRPQTQREKDKEFIKKIKNEV